MRKLYEAAAIIVLLMTAIAGSVQASQSLASDLSPHSISVTVDGINIAGQTTFLPPGAPGVTQADNAVQVADWSAVNPFREFSIAAVRYGRRSYPEGIATASPGAASIARAQYVRYRISQGTPPTDGPSASLFGHKAIGLASAEGMSDKPSLRRAMVEWFVEAQNRVWIVRVLEEVGDSQELDSFMKATSGVALDVAATPAVAESTNGAGSTTTLSPAASGVSSQREGHLGIQSHMNTMAAEEVAKTLPNAATGDYPSWWSGQCDNGNYSSYTGHPSSPLGTYYLGLPACGPLPNQVPWPDNPVHFFSGSVTELEFECVELSMRFLYLTYHAGPYSANGNQVVRNYNSSVPGYNSLLIKVQNGTAGQAPQPGDVLELGQGTQFGHTAVATSSSVNGSGNGSITVIEQNASASGSETWTVSGWRVQGSVYAVNEWLHGYSPGVKSRQIYLDRNSGGTATLVWDPIYLASAHYDWNAYLFDANWNTIVDVASRGMTLPAGAGNYNWDDTISWVTSPGIYRLTSTLCPTSGGQCSSITSTLQIPSSANYNWQATLQVVSLP